MTLFDSVRNGARRHSSYFPGTLLVSTFTQMWRSRPQVRDYPPVSVRTANPQKSVTDPS